MRDAMQSFLLRLLAIDIQCKRGYYNGVFRAIRDCILWHGQCHNFGSIMANLIVVCMLSSINTDHSSSVM